MASIGIPNLPITLSVSDPISADVQVALNALRAYCEFLSTPAGQQLVLKALNDVSVIETGIGKGLHAIAGLFHSTPKPAGGTA